MTVDGPSADEPEPRWRTLARKVTEAFRQFSERQSAAATHRRTCPECGATVVTEPTESGIECPDCSVRRIRPD